MLSRISVVVPAHDEEELLPACLDAIGRAADAVPEVDVEVVVALDACGDRSAEAVAAVPGVHAVTVTARNVGRARAAAVAVAALARLDVPDRVRRGRPCHHAPVRGSSRSFPRRARAATGTAHASPHGTCSTFR